MITVKKVPMCNFCAAVLFFPVSVNLKNVVRVSNAKAGGITSGFDAAGTSLANIKVENAESISISSMEEL